MLQFETMQPEPLDDRNIAKLEELFEAPSAPEPEYKLEKGLGDTALLEEIDKIIDDVVFQDIDKTLEDPQLYGPGDLVPHPTSMFGHAMPLREHIKWPQILH